jgi:large subunit ribosomal protein L4
MELKLLDAQGQAASKVEAPDTVFGRDFNEPLIHQVVIAYRANGRSANRAQKDRGEVKHSTEAVPQKGTGRARRHNLQPLWRGGGDLRTPRRELSHRTARYRAGVCSILSQLARDRVAVIGDSRSTRRRPLLADKTAMGMGLNGTSVLVITDSLDETSTASRNLPHVLVVEPRYADRSRWCTSPTC